MMSAKGISGTIAKTRILEPVILLVFWLLLFASPLILGYQQNDSINWRQVTRVWQSFIPYLLLFLVNRYVLLPFLFFNGKKWLFLILNLVLIFLLALFIHSWMPQPERFGPKPGEELLQRQQRDHMLNPSGPEFRADPPNRGLLGPEHVPPRPLRRGMPFYLNFVLLSILMLGFQSGLAVTFRWMDSERLRIHSEKENMAHQLAFLRNQVSPHFFMNTLNNIHALIEVDQDRAKDTIIRLSKLMRHLLYDSEVNSIPLEKELEFVSNYINLMKLRYGNHVHIQVEFPQEMDGVQVPPLLFTSYIENAFKYGVSANRDSYLRFSFQLLKGKLHFSSENSIFTEKESRDSTGIGLSNAARRLDLLYGDRYDLEIIQQKEKYIVNLSIPL
jgi:hypothetical protein